MLVLHKGTAMDYQKLQGEEVLWAIKPCQIQLPHITYVGDQNPKDYCIYMSDLTEEERQEIYDQIDLNLKGDTE